MYVCYVLFITYSILNTYDINVFEISEVEVVNAGFELFQYLIVTSHVGRQYQLPQLLQRNKITFD